MQIDKVKELLERKRRRLDQLKTGQMYFGTKSPGSSPNWKGETKEAIAELQAEIPILEFVLKDFDRK
jgi:hypothetical protein